MLKQLAQPGINRRDVGVADGRHRYADSPVSCSAPESRSTPVKTLVSDSSLQNVGLGIYPGFFSYNGHMKVLNIYPDRTEPASQPDPKALAYIEQTDLGWYVGHAGPRHTGGHYSREEALIALVQLLAPLG